MTHEPAFRRMEQHPLRLHVAAHARAFPEGTPHGAAARPLAPGEISDLRHNGCTAASWELVRVVDGCPLDGVRNVSFGGHCLIGLGDAAWPAPVLDRVRLENAWVGRGVAMRDVGMVRSAVVSGPGTELLAVTLVQCTGTRSFGLGEPIVFAPGNGRRALPALPGIWSTDLEPLARLPLEAPARTGYLSRCRDIAISWHGDFCCIGPDTVLVGCGIVEDSALSHVRAEMAPRICRSVLAGEPGRPAALRVPGVVERTVAGPGAEIATGACTDLVFLAEASWARDGARVHSSIIAPNSGVGSGELRYSFLGPFVGFSHEALCIAAFWPGGRGNVSYGANVGSNHTGRAADQEYWGGEGVFHGLDCAIKYPADTTRAPYTLIASGVVCLPQRLEFPFSLVNAPGHAAPGLPPAYNELVPGWQFGANLYGLLRSEAKFAERNRARYEPLEVQVLRGEWRPLIEDAIIRIEAALAAEPEGTLDSGEGYHTDRTLRGAGKNYVRRSALAQAVKHYQWGLELIAFFDPAERLPHHSGEMPPRILADIEATRRRDDGRGARIIPDYAEIHGTADDDPLVQQWRRRAAGERA
jgi:hypothetical protein